MVSNLQTHIFLVSFLFQSFHSPGTSYFAFGSSSIQQNVVGVDGSYSTFPLTAGATSGFEYIFVDPGLTLTVSALSPFNFLRIIQMVFLPGLPSTHFPQIKSLWKSFIVLIVESFKFPLMVQTS
jgi:hypothetical protein